MKVLLVDDNPKITSLLEKYLNLKGIQCIVCHTPQNAVNLNKNFSPDFVILDLSMPEYSGIDVLEDFKKNNLDTTNVIVLTAAQISNSEEEEIMKLGIKQFLRKPAELKNILSIIQG